MTHGALLLVLVLSGLSVPALVAPKLAEDTGLVLVAIAAGPECPDPQEAAFLRTINKYRKRKGLKSLALSKPLMLAAHKHSQDMAQMRRVSNHNLLGGVTTKQNLANHGYPVGRAAWGENLAYGTKWKTGRKAFNAWQHSPGHNQNMLNKQYRAIGIARVFDPSSTYKWYWTTTYGSVIGQRPHC
jgi:uncharacterized protein YkwD